MSFKTALTKLTKANAIDVSSNHIAYIQLVIDNCAKALQAVKSETDAINRFDCSRSVVLLHVRFT
jgi:hypothetical protein